jgi:hypothetical protein
MPTQQVTSNNYYIYNTPQAMISLILISKQNSLQKGEKTKRKNRKKSTPVLVLWGLDCKRKLGLATLKAK